MKSSPTPHLVLAVAALASAALSACVTTTRAHPELEARRSRIARAVVLPPDVSFKLITFEGDNPRLAAEEESAKRVLPGLIASRLRERGLTTLDLDSAGVAPGADVRFQATQLQGLFADAMGDLYRSLQMRADAAARVRRSLGSQASRVADPLGADVVALVHVEGFYKSGGEVAKDMAKSVMIGVLTLGTAVPVYPSKGAVLALALVDGSNGDVLWANVVLSQSVDLDAAGMESLVAAVFGPFPPGTFGTAVASGETAPPVALPAATLPAVAPVAPVGTEPSSPPS
ncbi:MAG: hypothetical protein HYY35_00925 [Deltaproteobacteria bacterium]|nr:hypothetical protein [Deltaproteobacteria bacterium]